MILHWLTLPWVTGGALEAMLFTISWLCLLYASSLKIHQKLGKPIPKISLKQTIPYLFFAAVTALMHSWKYLFK